MTYITKDSGQRKIFKTGMNRDINDDKPAYTLCIPLNCDNPMITRWAELMRRGEKKYGSRNWEKASTFEELERFKDSALRHMIQWISGDTTEDHASAVYFNIQGAELVKERLSKKVKKNSRNR